jgi:hypothetical protein
MARDQRTEADASSAATATASDSSATSDAGLAAAIDKDVSARPSPSEGSVELTSREKFQISCLRDARYHEDRERFFARLHKITMFVVVAAGTAAIAPIEQKSFWFPAIITLAGLVDLVFDVSGKARLHASLRRRIYELLAQAEDETSDISKLRQHAIGVYADEPPCMHGANALAYNGAMEALERPRELQLKITWLQRALRNVWPYPATTFRTFKEWGEVT